MSFIHLAPEWGPGKGDSQLGLISRTSEANEGSPSTTTSKPEESKSLGGANGGGDSPSDNGAIKKKRTPKFLVKQFGLITKASSGASPRRNLKLLGKEYVVAVPGSRAMASSNDTTIADPDPNTDGRHQIANAEPPTDFSAAAQHFAKPPIEFVSAPMDYKPDQRGIVRGEPSGDFTTDCSPRISPRVAPIMRHEALSRSHSSSGRSPSGLSRSHSSSGRSPGGSERLSNSHAGTPRSERSVLSIPETVISSAEHGYSRGSLKSASRTSHSSLAEWSSHSLERHGELSIAGLSLGEGRNVSGLSRRTDVTSAQSLARSDTQALHYSPDDTDSGVEMYHETTSASPGSYSSRRSSRNPSESWASEVEDSDCVSHHYRRSKNRSDHASSSSSYSSRSGSHSGARYFPATPTMNKAQYSPSTLRSLVSKQLLDSSSSKMRHHGDYYDHKRTVDSGNFSSRRHSSQKRRDEDHSALESSKVVVLLGKYGRRKGSTHGRQSRDMDDTAIPLESMTPQEAIAVFHDEVARMMLEEGQDCSEAHDVEEFLDGYMRLRSPFYLAMVDEFFRAVCVDCYKRPVELPVEGRSGSFSTSSKSLRSDSQLHHFHMRT